MGLRTRLWGIVDAVVTGISGMGHSSNSEKLSNNSHSDGSLENIIYTDGEYHVQHKQVSHLNGVKNLSDPQTPNTSSNAKVSLSYHQLAHIAVAKTKKGWLRVTRRKNVAFSGSKDFSSDSESEVGDIKLQKGTITGNQLTTDPETDGGVYRRKVAGNGPGLFALLIGINVYNGRIKTGTVGNREQDVAAASGLPSFNNLRGAVSDALSIQNYLTTELGVPQEHINLLRDGQATREGIIQAFKTLRDDENIRHGDVIFIFYAGHGAQALPPKRLLPTPGCPDRVELLIPHDYSNNPAKHKYMGIPDYTLAALLDQISKNKGNNITVVFDCCHSAGALRSAALEDQYITRSGPELPYNVPDELDQDIRQYSSQATRGMAIPQALKHLGNKSYVFFSACKSSERARETENRGCFTTALLKLLKQPEAQAALCTELISRMEKIEGQSPQCEGELQGSRPIFHTFVPAEKRRFFNVKSSEKEASSKNAPHISFIVDAGDIHGLAPSDELTIYKSKSDNDHAHPIGVVVVDQVFSDHSHAAVKKGTPTFSFSCNPLPALLTKRAPITANHKARSNCLNLYANTDELASHVHHIDKTINVVPDLGTAHISLCIDYSKEDPCLKFEVVDKDLLDRNVNLEPHFALIDDDDELGRILAGLSHFYSYLKRTSDVVEVVKEISVSFFKLEDTFSGQPRFIVPKDSEDMYKAGIIEVEVPDEDEEDIYGMQVTNNSESGGNLFPVLFYFDNTDFTISLSYHHPFAGDSPESPWPAKGQSMTIGYGVGPGSSVAPFSFYVNEDNDIEAGFFKLIFSTKPVDLQNVVQTVSPFQKTRACKQKPDAIPSPETTHRWGSITLPVVQRRVRRTQS